MTTRQNLEKKLLSAQQKLLLLEHDADPFLYALEPSAGRQCQQLLEREGPGLRGEIDALMAQITAFDDLGVQIQSAKVESSELNNELLDVARSGDVQKARDLCARSLELQAKVKNLKRQQAEMGASPNEP